jgi:two-component system nitrogen regulation response regulator GlnG
MSSTILLVDDDASILTVLSRALSKQGYHVETFSNVPDATRIIKNGIGDLVITDVTMPSGNGLDGLAEWHRLRPELPVIVMSAHNTLLNAARAQELGAVEFLPKPFDLESLNESVRRTLSHDARLATHDSDGIVRIDEQVTLVGKSPAMQGIFRVLARLITNDLTVLVQGESGTGKELVARALHALSKRKTAPFIALNMAAIPRELIESALFGHEKGAFTGAHQRQLGAFERAQGGTLFLDEIGDMPMEAQTRLLRVLQQGEFSPVGSVRSIKTDVRIIAATHHDLSQRVTCGDFREDLFYRLNVVPVQVPSLRERREDIPLLAQHFLKLATQRGLPSKQFDNEAMRALCDHAWKGNIRELENLVYRVCALQTPPVLQAEHVLAHMSNGAVVPLFTEATNAPSAENLSDQVYRHIRHYFATHGSDVPVTGLYDRVLRIVEKPLIEQTLRVTGGNQIKAAEILGINRNTLRKKMRELEIDAKRLMMDAA